MIYVYLKQCVQLAKNSAVRLGDVAQVVALGGGVKEARAVVLGRLEDSPFLLIRAVMSIPHSMTDRESSTPGTIRSRICRQVNTGPDSVRSKNTSIFEAFPRNFMGKSLLIGKSHKRIARIPINVNTQEKALKKIG